MRSTPFNNIIIKRLVGIVAQTLLFDVGKFSVNGFATNVAKPQQTSKFHCKNLLIYFNSSIILASTIIDFFNNRVCSSVD